MASTFLLTLALAAAAGAQAQPDPRLIRVWVSTTDSGHEEELAGRKESLKHLTGALAKQKKLVTLVHSEDLADVSVGVMERRVTVPRVAFGVGGRPGEPGMTAPARTVQLVATVKWRDEQLKLTNKNKPLESALGWSSAADDIAKQIEKWISDRRQRILDAR